MKRLIFIALILSLALAPCSWGQEGCGRWVKVKKGQMYEQQYWVETEKDGVWTGKTVVEKPHWFLLPDNLPPPDSIWVPENCPTILIDSVITIIHFTLPDGRDSVETLRTKERR